jgi:hypothetical protein
MLSFPTELWLLIGAHLSQHDLFSATQVNHAFHSQLTPVLYRNFVICGGYTRTSEPLTWRHNTTSSKCRSRRLSEAQYIEWSFATVGRLKRMQCSSELMRTIKSCTLCHFEFQNYHDETIAGAFKQALQEAVIFISQLPHCYDIVVNAIHINNSQLQQLVSHQSQPLNLSVQASIILESDPARVSDPQHQCSLKTLTIDDINGSVESVGEFAKWSMGVDLKEFAIQSVWSGHFSSFCNQLAQNNCPNLRRLELIRDQNCTQVLACLPMLEELILPRSFPPFQLTPTILPRLRTFHGSADQVRSIVPGRPIRALQIFSLNSLLSFSTGTEPPNFGSTVSILDLSIKGETPAREFWSGLTTLERIIDLCPSLQMLHFSSFLTFNINAVSALGNFEETISLTRQNTFTTDYMHKLYRLKHLRHLDCQFFGHVPSKRALAWEHAMCEAFRTRSAPNIHHVSFSPIVEWDRVPYDTTWVPSGWGISANPRRDPKEIGWTYPHMAAAEWPEAPFPMDAQ